MIVPQLLLYKFKLFMQDIVPLVFVNPLFHLHCQLCADGCNLRFIQNKRNQFPALLVNILYPQNLLLLLICKRNINHYLIHKKWQTIIILKKFAQTRPDFRKKPYIRVQHFLERPNQCFLLGRINVGIIIYDFLV